MTETIVFGGGCFWCTEVVFKMLKGVASVTPGYAGGSVANPSYREISSGKTGHAEVIKVEYDPAVIKFSDLLTVFFASHDPTTKNRQGADVGEQYRSAIYYSTDAQKKGAEAFIKTINLSDAEGDAVTTEIKPLNKFYPAEDYHQDYYSKNPEAPYCQVVINPKLKKMQEKFAQLLDTA